MRVLISGGGTGGHLFPAIAVAQALSRTDPEGDILYMGRRGALEAETVRAYGIKFQPIAAAGLYTDEVWRNWRLPLALPTALIQARLGIARFRPRVVLGTGGYVSVPVVLAAAASRIPVVLQEQNLVPGRATRWLSRVARVVAIAYPEAAAGLRCPAVITGTPVREAFASRRATFPERPRTVLVLGGSQGAHRINEAVATALPDLLARADLRIVHQTGPRDEARMLAVRSALPSAQQPRYTAFAFTDDLAGQLRSADLVVGRAGASTLSEVSAVGVPMIGVPYPFAGGHQRHNLRPFVERGAVVSVDDDAFDGPRLAREVLVIADDPVRYRRMVAAMETLGRPDAAAAVAALLRREAEGTE